MKPWKVILATLVIFGAGVVTGALTVNLTRRVNPKPAPPPVIFSALQRKDYLAQLDRRVGLSQEQYEAIEEILGESHARTEALWNPIAPKLREEVRSMHDKIRAELTPEQQKKFDAVTLKPRGARKPEGLPGAEPPRKRYKPASSSNPPPAADVSKHTESETNR
ncbi:MAG: hypothetical protein HY300_10485 [Verrucomicrobia bacterium]|nr:hypothetical protein [Verrucomicrobiota bacterium]